MRNLINLIRRYYFTILFVLLEAFCVFLVVTYNDYQSTRAFRITQNISGYLHEQANTFNEFIFLKDINKELLTENRYLRNKLRNKQLDTIVIYRQNDSITDIEKHPDTTTPSQYRYITAEVVNNSVNKQYNYITINKGADAGIEKEMAVISSRGVVGIIKDVTSQYAVVLPMLNLRFKMSAKILNNGYIGSLSWDGKNARYVQLNEIPYHVNISHGDTVVSSGYSAIFPEGVPIGYIEEYDLKEGNFYNIQVKTATNFQRLHYVYVIHNRLKEAQRAIESKIRP